MATGQHCPEGWTLYPLPGPNYKNAADSGSADSAYYDFVDRFDMLGVGKDVPLATGNLSEGLLALVDGKIMTLRVPYPMGFFAKGIDGRIDNPNGGWKGKGVYHDHRHARAVPPGGRQGRDEQVDQVPDAPGPVGEVKTGHLIILTALVWLGGVTTRAAQSPAATLKNPIASSPESIAAGKQVYTRTLRSLPWHERRGRPGQRSDPGGA